jgi:hypothetical protein
MDENLESRNAEGAANMNTSTDAALGGRRSRGFVFRLAAILTPGLIAALAIAEPKPVDPYFVIVSGESAPLVCMPNDSAYTVAEVKAGTVLRVDADDARWARVEYPAGAKAFVRVDDGSIENGQLRLTKPTKLFARNQTKGGGGSWKAVFDVELPVGTLLTLAEPSAEKQGELVIGYNVIAPTGAKGFVESKTLRRATQAEVDGAKTSGGLVEGIAIAPSGGGVTPTGVEIAKETKPAPTTPTTTDVTPTKVTGAAGAGDAQVTPIPGAVTERRIGDLKQLEAAFAEVVKQPVGTAEFSELIVEFQRAIDAVPAEKTTQKKQLKQRLDYLNLRKEYQASVLAAQEAQKSDGAMQEKLKAAVSDIERTRIYTIIGTLQPSSVYDGVRLPRMYRVQSVGDVNARTLGYITPHEDLNLDGKIGQVVGIVGQAQLDPNLRLNVIAPVRVDILKPGETKFVAPANTADKDMGTTTELNK